MEAVSDILTNRALEPAGLRRMVAVSLVGHVVLTATFLLMPSLTPRDTPPREVMTISLGGAPGPRVGGMTPMGGRAVQAPAPEPAKPTRVTPPAAKTPEMVLPTKQTKQPAKTPVKQAPDEARSRTPTTGPTPREGNTIAETGGQGQQFGLTTGGGGTGGYLDVANFCCPEYLSTMLQLIQRNWNSRQQVAGQTTMRFTIERDGRISALEVERSSGYFALDQTAQRALMLTRQFPPLPAQYTGEDLTVHLNFRYER
jgi:protein TonB